PFRPALRTMKHRQEGLPMTQPTPEQRILDTVHGEPRPEQHGPADVDINFEWPSEAESGKFMRDLASGDFEGF
uniref:hypothetical protein n=2 Tax=Corynebacterium humireducens TaxID=1223514 RepID=UPI001C3F2412